MLASRDTDIVSVFYASSLVYKVFSFFEWYQMKDNRMQGDFNVTMKIN